MTLDVPCGGLVIRIREKFSVALLTSGNERAAALVFDVIQSGIQSAVREAAVLFPPRPDLPLGHAFEPLGMTGDYCFAQVDPVAPGPSRQCGRGRAEHER